MSEPQAQYKVAPAAAHYQKYEHQPFDAFMERSSTEQAIGALNFNVLKYALRWQDKNGLEDLEKCRWYLNSLIKLLEESQT